MANEIVFFVFMHDTEKDRLNSEGWMQLMWTHDRLVWDAQKYPSIKGLRLPSDLIWTPDTRVYNR